MKTFSMAKSEKASPSKNPSAISGAGDGQDGGLLAGLYK